jgi:hypothetical protein
METSDSGDQGQTLNEIRDMVTQVRNLLLGHTRVKEHYSVSEAAEFLGKAEFTVREYCRHGRIHANKRKSGRGRSAEWVLSHTELLRIEKEGLLPLRKY